MTNIKKSIFYRSAAGNFLILLGPLLVGFVLAFVVGLSRFADPESSFFYLGVGLMVIGWCLLVKSKWRQIREGKLLTFGVSPGDSKSRVLYRMSYAVMIVGYLIATFSGRF